MVRAIEVARRLVELAVGGEEPDPLTPLRLQKLLYYVQGWHLGVYGRPLFPERFRAWKLGPVVCEVYQEFKGSSAPARLEDIPPSSLPDDVRLFVDGIWDRYKEFSPSALLRMTHEEPPWRHARARAGAHPEDQCQELITPSDMEAYFRERGQKARLPGIDPAGTFRALEQVERGQVKPHTEVMAEMHARMKRARSQEGGGACTG